MTASANCTLRPIGSMIGGALRLRSQTAASEPRQARPLRLPLGRYQRRRRGVRRGLASGSSGTASPPVWISSALEVRRHDGLRGALEKSTVSARHRGHSRGRGRVEEEFRMGSCGSCERCSRPAAESTVRRVYIDARCFTEKALAARSRGNRGAACRSGAVRGFPGLSRLPAATSNGERRGDRYGATQSKR